MGMMLQDSLRAPVTRLITPICRDLLRLGISANAITAIGAIFTAISAISTFPRGHFLIGTILILFFVLFDLLDGTMARISQKGASRWGALLDSTLDRLTDAVITGCVLLYLISSNDRLVPLVLVVAVLGFLISYIKARSESLGIACEGGLAERSERLILILITTGAVGLGIPFAMSIGFWILAVASVITVAQRLLIVFNGAK